MAQRSGAYLKRQLYIIRHAKSSWKTDLPDRERPLNGRGRKDAPKMAKKMLSAGLIPDFVLCSDALRAMETWDLMQVEFAKKGHEIPVEFHSSLYFISHGGPTDSLQEIANAIRDDTRFLALVGHNPAWDELVEQLSGEEVRLTTCNVAIVTNESNSWKAFFEANDATLVDVLRPRPPRSQ